jgi:hypothetical protein
MPIVTMSGVEPDQIELALERIAPWFAAQALVA